MIATPAIYYTIYAMLRSTSIPAILHFISIEVSNIYLCECNLLLRVYTTCPDLGFLAGGAFGHFYILQQCWKYINCVSLYLKKGMEFMPQEIYFKLTPRTANTDYTISLFETIAWQVMFICLHLVYYLKIFQRIFLYF